MKGNGLHCFLHRAVTAKYLPHRQFTLMAVYFLVQGSWCFFNPRGISSWFVFVSLNASLCVLAASRGWGWHVCLMGLRKAPAVPEESLSPV